MKQIYLKKKIQDEIALMNDRMKQVLNSFDWLTETMMIAREQGLGLVQVESFQEITAMIVLGIESADGYARRVATALGITETNAGLLVQEANDRIFAELSARASALESNTEDTIENHAEIARTLSQEGIDLLDHDVDMTLPSNVHQDVESLQKQFKSQELKNRHIYSHAQNNPIQLATPVVTRVQKFNEKTSTSGYNEDIDPTDLAGVAQHRLDTSILENMTPLQKKALENYDMSVQPAGNRMFEERLLSTTRVSQDDYYDMSPVSKQDMLNGISTR